MTTNGLSSSQLPPGMGISKYVVRKDRYWGWTSQNLNAVQWVQDDFHTLFTAHFWPLCTGISGYTRLTWWWCMSMLMLIANRVNIIPITIVIRWNWQLCHYKLLFWPSFSTIYYTDFALVLPRTLSFIFQCLFGRFLVPLELVQSIIFPE